MILFRLFYYFFKVGLFSFGGGMATVPFLYEIGEQTGWFTPQELTNMIAVSESTPGPIGANMATYVGYTSAGILGGIVATLGLITPSVIVIILIAKVLTKYRNSPAVNDVFTGLRPASLALICSAWIGIAKVSLLNIPLFKESGGFISVFNVKTLILAVVLYFAIKKIKCHPIFFILASAVIGIIFKMA